MRKHRAFVLALACALSNAAAAQTTTDGASSASQEQWQIPEIVITAKQPGPVFWKIEQGDSQVLVLGIPDYAPIRTGWDQTRFKRLLAAAHEVILPPDLRGGAVMGEHLKLQGKASLADVLSERAYAKLQTLASDADQPAKKYDGYRPGMAALMGRTDSLKALQVSPTKLTDDIRSVAEDAGVKVRTLKTYDVGKLIGDLAQFDPSQAAHCLDEAVDDYDFMLSHEAKQAAGWATGDLAEVRDNYEPPAFNACLEQSAYYNASKASAINDIVAAVHTSLGQKGRTIMVFTLSNLLRTDGALAKLKAEGLQITAPKED